VSSQPIGPTYYADFNGLEGLKKGAKADDPKAIRAAAQQFESLFTDMMLKSMREAKLGQGLGDTQESDLYQDMYDQQLSLKMAQGKGIGLADMLVQQLTRNSAAKAAAGSAWRQRTACGRIECRSHQLCQKSRALRRARGQSAGRLVRYADCPGGTRDRLGTTRSGLQQWQLELQSVRYQSRWRLEWRCGQRADHRIQPGQFQQYFAAIPRLQLGTTGRQ
jgi:Rod binding domain-containing protein